MLLSVVRSGVFKDTLSDMYERRNKFCFVGQGVCVPWIFCLGTASDCCSISCRFPPWLHLCFHLHLLPLLHFLHTKVKSFLLRMYLDDGESRLGFPPLCFSKLAMSSFKSSLKYPISLTATSARQLAVDISYLGEILDDLGHPLSTELARYVQSLLAV